MILEVHGLEVFGRHGVNEDERRVGQTFLVDVTLERFEPDEDSIGATADGGGGGASGGTRGGCASEALAETTSAPRVRWS